MTETTIARASNAAPANQPPFLKLPVELRNMIYRLLLGPLLGGKAVCHYNSDTLPCQKLLCFRDLQLMRVNRQIREESQEFFYTDNIFVLDSTKPRLTYLYTAKAGEKRATTMVDLGRVRKLHLCARNNGDSYIGINIMVDILVSLLPTVHKLQYLLVQALAIEFTGLDFKASLSGSRTFVSNTRMPVLEPLRHLKNLKQIHIQAYSSKRWPYLRALEQQMTNTETTTAKAGLKDSSNGDPSEASQECSAKSIYRMFRTQPLYSRKDVEHYRARLNNFAWSAPRVVGGYLRGA